MWVLEAERKQLLDFVQSDRKRPAACEVVELLPVLKEAKTELLFVWPYDPAESRRLPPLIVTEDDNIRDLFAWTATYLTHCRPLTASCRVLPRTSAAQCLEFSSIPLSAQAENACLGAILGETSAYANAGDVRRYSRPIFAGTYSFALTKALAQGSSINDVLTVGDAWTAVRKRTGLASLSIPPDQLNPLWRVLLSVVTGESSPKRERSLASQACRELFQGGDLSTDVWSQLGSSLFSTALPKDVFAGPREQRVVYLEEALGNLASQRRAGDITNSFTAGYLASLVSPGTFDHAELLRPVLEELPSAPMWYGVCAGLHPASKLQNLGRGLGRRITQSATYIPSVLDAPTCDISNSELEVLNGGSAIENASHFTVEIAPCIDCEFRRHGIDVRGQSHGTQTAQRTLFENEFHADPKLQDLLFDLTDRLALLEDVRRRIERHVNKEPPATKKRRRKSR